MLRDPARIGCLLLLAWVAPAQAEVFEAHPVAVTGDAAPGTGGVYTGFYGSFSLNASSQVSYTAQLQGGSASDAIFRSDAGTALPLVRIGDPAPSPIAGGDFAFLMSADVADDGSVLFLGSGSFSPTGPAFSGIFVATELGVEAVVVDGQAAPGVPGGVFESFGGADRNEAGDVAFRSTVRVGDTPVRGIFLADEGGPTLLVREGDPAPGTGGAGFVDLFDDLQTDDAGEVVFVASYRPSPTNDKGVFVASPTGVRAVALEGDPAPGGGTFTGFETQVSLDADGHAVFVADLDGVPGAGLFVETSSGLHRVARAGDPAPGTSEAFQQFLDPDLNEAGDVLFWATLSESGQAIFVERSASQTLQLVHRSGEPAPPPLDGTLLGPAAAHWGPAGDIVFFSWILAENGIDYRDALLRTAPAPQVPIPGTAPIGIALLLLVSGAGALVRRR